MLKIDSSYCIDPSGQVIFWIVGEPFLKSCSLYCRAASIVLVSAWLGACSTAGGLDVIAADISPKDAAAASAEISAMDGETAMEAVMASALSAEDGDIPINAYAKDERPPVLASTSFEANGSASSVGANSPELHALIDRYAAHYNVPAQLVRRVVKRESNFDPSARNKIYWGLMQIRHDTARTMGYRGSASGLLDAETNLKYAVKYLRGAYLTADRNEDQAVRFYARGYYYDAKRKGLLQVTGLRP